jgi:hypothetical protein
MKRCLILIFSVMLLSISSLAAQENLAFVPVPCPFELPADEIEGETIDCGVVTVPESRTGLSDANIELAVLILHATGEETLAPILYLAGGPGNSGTTVGEDFFDDPIRELASIIFLDQRGTFSRSAWHRLQRAITGLPRSNRGRQ